MENFSHFLTSNFHIFRSFWGWYCSFRKGYTFLNFLEDNKRTGFPHPVESKKNLIDKSSVWWWLSYQFYFMAFWSVQYGQLLSTGNMEGCNLYDFVHFNSQLDEHFHTTLEKASWRTDTIKCAQNIMKHRNFMPNSTLIEIRPLGLVLSIFLL